MPEDAKAKARKAARRAQSDFAQAQEKLDERREARRAAFEQARAAGLSTREIAEATGLPVVIAEDPLTCVARGRGKAMEIMDRHHLDLVSTE